MQRFAEAFAQVLLRLGHMVPDLPWLLLIFAAIRSFLEER